MSPGLIVITIIALYFLPTIIAALRSHPSGGGILALNTLLGWTFIGWVISLVWSLSDTRQMKQSVIVNNIPAPEPQQSFRGMPVREGDYSDSEVLCPMCAEAIKVGARKCKHCGEYFSEPVRPMRTIETHLKSIEAEWSEIETVQPTYFDKTLHGFFTGEPFNPWMIALWAFGGTVALILISMLVAGIEATP